MDARQQSHNNKLMKPLLKDLISILGLVGGGIYFTYMGYFMDRNVKDEKPWDDTTKWKNRIVGPGLICIAFYGLFRSCSN